MWVLVSAEASFQEMDGLVSIFGSKSDGRGKQAGKSVRRCLLFRVGGALGGQAAGVPPPGWGVGVVPSSTIVSGFMSICLTNFL